MYRGRRGIGCSLLFFRKTGTQNRTIYDAVKRRTTTTREEIINKATNKQEVRCEKWKSVYYENNWKNTKIASGYTVWVMKRRIVHQVLKKNNTSLITVQGNQWNHKILDIKVGALNSWKLGQNRNSRLPSKHPFPHPSAGEILLQIAIHICVHPNQPENDGIRFTTYRRQMIFD